MHRRDLLVGFGTFCVIGTKFSRAASAPSLQLQTGQYLTPNDIQGIEAVLHDAQRQGLGPSGPQAAGALDPLDLADIIDRALVRNSPAANQLAKQTGSVLSALNSRIRDTRDVAGPGEPVAAGPLPPTSLPDLKAYYTNLCKTAAVDAHFKSQLTRIANTISLNKQKYLDVENKTGVPWYVIGGLHYREANLNFMGHLHNGDYLLELTHDVPKDRPSLRPWPPANETLQQIWVDSAIDALRNVKSWVPTWTEQATCYAMEKYNGFGCYYHGINTPYLWNFTNLYKQGGYDADGHYVPSYVSKQAGLYSVLLALESVAGQLAPPFTLET